MYFRFKDEVFQGMMRPYDHAPFEKLLKDYFTHQAVMTDIKKPKVSYSILHGNSFMATSKQPIFLGVCVCVFSTNLKK